MTESTTATTSKTRRGGKRGNGEGNIRQRPDGLWEARISLEDGRRKSLYGKTRQEVASKLAKTTHDRDAGLPIVRSERQTVTAYLETWLAAVEGRVKPRTHVRYGELIRLYVLPILGKVALAKLTAAQLEALYTLLLKRGLSPTTVHHVHAVVRTALGSAERQQIIPRNVASLAVAPRMRRIEMQTLTADEARRLLETARGERLEALYMLALSTGMRQGELLGLRWREVDLDHATARVTATLQKTGAGLKLATPKDPSK